MLSFYSGLTYSPNNITSGDGTLVLRSSNVKNGEISLNDNVYVDSKIVNSDNVKNGDIIVVVRNGSRDLIGKHAQIKGNMPNTVIGAFMTGIRSDEPEFINSLLATKQFTYEIEKNLGATINQITTGNFKEMQFMTPSNKKEKYSIGKLFLKLDNLITLHQCKYKYKKLVQTNCLHFFIISWEQRKLGSVAIKVTEKNVENTIKETFTNSAEMGIVSQRDFFDHDIAKADKIDGYYVVENNDFVYNPRISTTAPCGPINRNKLGRKGVMSPLYTVFKPYNVNHLYLEWYFKNSYWYSYMYFNGDSGARSDRFSIKNDLFFSMPIPIPSDKEQEKVGIFLESINNLITLHQCKYKYILRRKL